MKYWLGQIAEAVESLGGGCKIDPTVSDLPRVMRCPGTINMKTGRQATVINGLTDVYSTLGMELIAQTPEKALAYEPSGVVSSSKTWQEATPLLTNASRNYLLRGKSEPGRHTAMWHLVRNLWEHGLVQEQAEAAAAYANMQRGEDEALSAIEVEKIITQVYGGY
jgi:hypothetical protein